MVQTAHEANANTVLSVYLAELSSEAKNPGASVDTDKFMELSLFADHVTRTIKTMGL